MDKNPFAVNLAKLSLWLVTLAKDQPFTFVDHALKCGDSLVGLTRAEIGSFGKDPTQDLPLFKYLKEKVDRAKAYRTQIQALDTRTDEDAEAKLSQWQRAELELEEAKLIGDVKIAAFFNGSSKKERDAKLSEYTALVRNSRQAIDTEDNEASIQLKTISNALRQATKPITPFSWDIEFPEVFDRKNPGFDGIVGNPPFAGKNTTINGNPEGYIDWLKIVHHESHGNADVVAHFFRRSHTLLRSGGTMGLIATNTIAQGDTRSTGLRFICNNGGMIYNATRRYKWPGLAAVVVSLVHIMKVTR
ncbi:Eco57I restriction-modification methylase domain-containing protein [Synechococcus sp. PCC 6312]|uniref:Eco57I restriction-modification methylase domain-containing protein n=1 Tax=Synechococcus sp. (strain ATCC 27167 / PCC 6312) TaxID=195253 RepID=UPI000684E055|nr:DNA methyltransferase [Synechococcus sp. PCC 6312]